MSNFVVERRHIRNPISASDWEEWSEWYALESFDSPKGALDFINHGHALVDTLSGYSYENRIVTSDGRVFVVKDGAAELAGLFEEPEPFVIQYRVMGVSWGGEWKNLLEKDAPKPKTLEDAWSIVESERVHDASSSHSYEYQILNSDGEVVGNATKPLVKKEKVSVDKERWLEVCAIELRLTDELDKVMTMIDFYKKNGSKESAYAVLMMERHRDELKRFLGRET